MKRPSGCHCGQVKFETDLETMIVAQCNRKSCRRMSGSLNLGGMYAKVKLQ